MSVPKNPIITPILMNIFTTSLPEAPIDFKIPISTRFSVTNFTKFPLILNEAIIIMSARMRNMTAFSIFIALKRLASNTLQSSTT